MSMRRWIRCRGGAGLVALLLCIVATGTLTGQGVAPNADQVRMAAGFKEFSDRVSAYVKLQKTIESSLPSLKPTDLPEMITAHQAALARKIREARPRAKSGDIFTSAACKAFRRASRGALEGRGSATSRAYMGPGEANPNMSLRVNGIYPDAEPITALSPALLAAFPPLPAQVAYRIVGRTLILVDVESRLIIDFARRILPEAS
jgi:hypothetical protein